MRTSLSPGTIRSALVTLVIFGLSACAVLRPPGYSEFRLAVDSGDALRIYDKLEALIAEDDDTRNDRKNAFAAVRNRNEDTAAFQFAWAAIAGRLVQQRGLLAANLVKQIEEKARRSVELDPKFRDGAATRLLGTMYVVAPSSFVEHGNSELGLEMLLGLVEQYPNDPENHLRAAEAYIALNDPEPAAPHICACLPVREQMRRDYQKLLENLIADAGKVVCGDTTVTVAEKKHR
jgi:hypothetical protein